ncbi:hypothetical protein HU200_066370 [Digitaria exilis]|uniref:F-box domain-containing protein n=1 Tax=Digitaria exilis TaxID=1010633 RepID=A0A835DX53_9POAL|nr:hypothetical protein HU200_066370 [Digitaria exilis]
MVRTQVDQPPCPPGGFFPSTLDRLRPPSRARFGHAFHLQLVDNFSRPSVMDIEHHLRWVLLRAQVIDEEAFGRNITNRAMLQQLDMLRDAMYQGYFKLDGFRYQHHNKEVAKHKIVSHYSLLSKLISVKDFRFSSGTSRKILEELQELLDSLSSMIVGTNELVMFLKSFPRLYHQPYCMHLVFENSMFGRQMETEHIISFLLHTKPHHSQELLEDGRLLVVVEVAGDLTEDAWKKCCSALKRCAAKCIKIIITSRCDNISKLGTTGVIALKYLRNEAFWYFFKTLTFGTNDPDKHPRLAFLAMEMARMLNGNFIGANGTAFVLRDNFDIDVWCKVLAFFCGVTHKHISKFGGNPSDLLNQNRPAHLGRMARDCEAFMVYDQYHRSSQEEVPNMTLQDVLYGSAKTHGKFEVLAWRSRIPPYHSHVYACEIQEPKPRAAKRKRSMRNGVMPRLSQGSFSSFDSLMLRHRPEEPAAAAEHAEDGGTSLFSDLPEDLVAEILLRVTPPALQRLRHRRVAGVCRSWRRIIADADFRRRYAHHHRAEITARRDAELALREEAERRADYTSAMYKKSYVRPSRDLVTTLSRTSFI